MITQFIKPNLKTTEEAGMCLSYVRRAFGAKVVETTAWNAWLNAKKKHEDRNFPNVAVPVYFDWSGDLGDGDGYRQYGHVAIRTPNGKVYSSPLYGHGSVVFNSVDELTQAFGNNMRYVGWSEDISNVTVVGDNMYEGRLENKTQKLTSKQWYEKAVHYRKRTIEVKKVVAKLEEELADLSNEEITKRFEAIKKIVNED